jgi:hypothetical protein
MISIGEMQPEPDNSENSIDENINKTNENSAEVNNTEINNIVSDESDQPEIPLEVPIKLPDLRNVTQEFTKENPKEEIVEIEETSVDQLPEDSMVETVNADDINIQNTEDTDHMTDIDNPVKSPVSFTIPNPWDDDVDESLYQPSHQKYYDYSDNPVVMELADQVQALEKTKQQLEHDIHHLQEARERLQSELISQSDAMGRLMQEALHQYETRKQVLQMDVEKLERRQERINKEIKSSFAGVSQDLAIRVQGFKEYLVGSLQDLAIAAEQLELTPPPAPPSVERKIEPLSRGAETEMRVNVSPKFNETSFQQQTKQIRGLLDQYRSAPDYYGPPWQLRRTFESIHAERVANWFFTQGGRGALKSMGSRLQNILVASAIASILKSLFGKRLRVLVLANSPERLGEWRRGLQDCLGLDRADFGPERGVGLFEEAEVLSQKADRLVKDGRLPLIIVDDTENKISLAMLQYPLWLAFASEPTPQAGYMDNY